MRIDALSAELRPRNRWEAIDLGFAMTRRWWRPVFAPWLIVLAGVAVLLAPLWYWYPSLALFGLWWLKPLLDRVPLHVLSRALFGPAPATADTLRALPRLLWPQCLPALLWLRFDPARSFHLPVLQLEYLRGRARRQRQRLLDMGDGGGGWLTVVCLHFDLLLQLTLLGTAAMLFPELVSFSLLEPATIDDGEALLLALAALLALALIEPFYVAGGFALYLNRRTRLEGWDLEIGFRRLAQRLRNAPAVLLAPVLLALLLNPDGEALAQPQAGETGALPAEAAVDSRCRRLLERQRRLSDADDEASRALAELYRDDPHLPRCELRRDWRFDDESVARPDNPLSLQLGVVLEGLLWLLAALALAFVAHAWWRGGRWRPTPTSLPPPPRPSSDAPRVGELSPADAGNDDAVDAPQRALALWGEGRQRAALGLLYRATLARLARRHGLTLGASANEDDWLRHGARHFGESERELLDYLTRLTRCWQGLAYAHRPPSTAAMTALCRQWPWHPEADGAPARRPPAATPNAGSAGGER